MKTLGIYTGVKIVSGTNVSGAAIYVSKAPNDIKKSKTTTSAKNGAFSFTVPAKNYYVPKIVKEGYALVNTNLISDRHTASEEPLTVLLLSKSQQQKYEAEIRQKAQAGTQKEINKLLAKIKSLNSDIDVLKSRESSSQSTIKLLEDERDKLQSQLITAQEQQEQKVKDMVEEYRALDFDALDDFYKEVKRLIIDGEYQRADSLLNTRGDLTAQVREQQEARAALDKREIDLAERCYSKYEIFAAQFQNDSAAYYLELRASLDTTNVEWQKDAGVFYCYSLQNHNKGIEYFNRILNVSQKQKGEYSDDWKVRANILLGETYIAKYSYYFGYTGALSSKWNIDEEDDVYFQKAWRFYNDAILECTSIYGENSFQLAMVYESIGMMYSRVYGFQYANYYLEKSLAILTDINCKDDVTIARLNDELGDCEVQIGKSQTEMKGISVVVDTVKRIKFIHDAIKRYEKALSLREASEEFAFNEIFYSYIRIGNAYLSIGNFETAINCYHKAKSTIETFHENNKMELSVYYITLSNYYRELNENEKEIEYLLKYIEAQKDAWGVNHLNVILSYDYLCTYYAKIGKRDEMINLKKSQLEKAQQYLGETNQWVAIFHNQLAQYYFSEIPYSYLFTKNEVKDSTTIWQNFDKSLYHYQCALNITEHLFGKESVNCAIALSSIAKLFHHVGKNDKALAYYMRCEEIYSQDEQNHEHELLADVYDGIASIYDNQKRYKLELQYLEKAKILYQQSYGEEHFFTRSMQSRIDILKNIIKINENYE